jgi:hypothetical protein
MLVLPAGLPGYEKSDYGRINDNIGPCVMVTLTELQIQLRLHDYFMGNQYSPFSSILEPLTKECRNVTQY